LNCIRSSHLKPGASTIDGFFRSQTSMSDSKLYAQGADLLRFDQFVRWWLAALAVVTWEHSQEAYDRGQTGADCASAGALLHGGFAG
jgi:hypothetical protein